jgi:integrase
MKRRGHGEGSIYQRKSDGLWVGTVDLGWQGGRRVRKSYYGKTRREVQDKLSRARLDVEEGVRPSTDRETVAAYLAEWLESSRPSLRHSTARRYAQIVRRQLIPGLGRIPLRS